MRPGSIDSRSSGFPRGAIILHTVKHQSASRRCSTAHSRRESNTSARPRRSRRGALARVCCGLGGDSTTRRSARRSPAGSSGAPQHEQWFDELQRVSTSPENAARLMERDDDIDVRPLLSQVKTPTLVIHCDRDRAVAPEKGRLLAAGSRCPLRLPAERESPDARGGARLASIPRRARPVPELVTPFFQSFRNHSPSLKDADGLPRA